MKYCLHSEQKIPARTAFARPSIRLTRWCKRSIIDDRTDRNLKKIWVVLSAPQMLPESLGKLQGTFGSADGIGITMFQLRKLVSVREGGRVSKR